MAASYAGMLSPRPLPFTAQAELCSGLRLRPRIHRGSLMDGEKIDAAAVRPSSPALGVLALGVGQVGLAAEAASHHRIDGERRVLWPGSLSARCDRLGLDDPVRHRLLQDKPSIFCRAGRRTLPSPPESRYPAEAQTPPEWPACCNAYRAKRITTIHTLRAEKAVMRNGRPNHRTRAR
jgi:hypothetical protein